jgi:predicted phosphodiesterase
MQLYKTNLLTSKIAIHSLAFSFCTLFLLSCANTSGTQKKSEQRQIQDSHLPSGDPVFTLILIGDTGNNFSSSPDLLMESLQQQINQLDEQSTIVFLGDNLYPNGLPPENHPSRKEMEDKLSGQLNIIQDFPGRIIFVPGNHDWQSSGENGLEWVRRQERFIESSLDRGNTFLPDSGYPGPVRITLHEAKIGDTSFNIQLVALDTHWWLHPHEKPHGDNTEGQKRIMLDEIDQLLSSYNKDEIVVAAHHPLFSYGRHGGNFSIRPHLLPPLFGSLYVVYRKVWGLPQDLARYSDLRNELLTSFEQVEGLIYAAGHEHSLQYIPNEDDHFIVSGSASKTTYVKKKSSEAYTYGEKGFITVKYYKDRSKVIEFWNETGSSVYQNQIDKN